MNQSKIELEQLAATRKIKIHDPFAEYLNAKSTLHTFELSLLDCYKLSGHACHAITGAFLVTEAAVAKLFPETLVCERGDLSVEFGSKLEENASGPRSQVISFLTGAWGETGFPGMDGQFRRKGLMTFGNNDLSKNEIRFRRTSTEKEVVITYDPTQVIRETGSRLEFPESWRMEVDSILKNSDAALQIQVAEEDDSESCEGSGCC